MAELLSYGLYVGDLALINCCGLYESVMVWQGTFGHNCFTAPAKAPAYSDHGQEH